MTPVVTSFADLSDDQLRAAVKRLAATERQATAALIRSLMELDARRFPLIIDALEDGALTLTAVRLLAPHLTAANHRGVLASARHARKVEIERLVASLNPKPAVPAVIRRLPECPMPPRT